MQEPNIQVKGSSFRAMFMPIVYHWHRGSDSLYIGMSRFGWQRLISSHHTVTRVAVQPDDVIDIYYCDSNTEALQLEAELLSQFTPRFNCAGGGLKPRKPDFRRSSRYHSP